MNSVVRMLKNSLHNHHFLTNAVINGLLSVAGEFSQQTITTKIIDKSSKAYDIQAILKYGFCGTYVAGPMLALWYRFLDKKMPGTAAKTVVKKVLIDQFIFNPHLLAVFFISMSIMEKKSDIFEECREKFAQAFRTSCTFWIPVQAINFMVINPAFRVIYIGVCSFVWINILSFIKIQAY